MEDKGYISKKKKGDSLYEHLHQEALEIIQKLSGDVWTDYNEHDPGVTLLENISYAITELDHKIKLPVKDLLQSAKQGNLNSGDNGLFIASDILTTNPVTFKDYRKIWIDQIPNIKNIWIYPVDDYEKELNNIKGLLHVYVEKYNYHVRPELEQKENDEIKAEITRVYENHRNLCEGLYAIEVYKPLALVIELKIVLSNTVDGEEVLANILHRVNDYLAPEVSYFSLQQLQEEGLSVQEIFNGPKLANGFIREESLRDPLEIIEISEIVKIISKIPGVININNFSLSYINPRTQQIHVIKDRFRIPKNMTARVLFPNSNEQLVFQNSDVTFYPDLAQTKKQLAFIQALVASKFKAASNSENSLLIPKGNIQDINYHFPIRKQLPEIYGVGDRGIDSSTTPLREAQVKQLQAYLLPFDQLIVNFLAQLANIYTLFDIHGNQHASYFTNSLPDVKEIESLIQPPNTSLNQEEIQRYWEMVTNDLNSFFDNHAEERLNKVADQLLSRYAEAFQTYSLLKINKTSYGKVIPEERFKKRLLSAKQELIRNYGDISYHRSTAYNYKIFPSEHDILLKQPLSGVFKKIAILTEMYDFQIGSFTKAIDASGINIHPQNTEIDIIVQEIDIHIENDFIEIEEIDYLIKDEDIEDRLFDNMHYVGSEDSLLDDVLNYGMDADNYAIVKAPYEDEDYYYVLHKREEKKSNIVHIASSKEAAQKAIEKSINYLVTINQQSEGFLVLEHVLLLPNYLENAFGFEIDFSLLDPSLDIVLTHQTKIHFAKRDKVLDTLAIDLATDELRYDTITEKGEIRLAIRTPEGEILAISKNTYITVNEVEATVKNLQQVASNSTKEEIETIAKCYVYYGVHPVDELFFSFQMSFVLPTWPIRFQNENFKKVFENTVYDEVPIHIVSNIHWLNYKKLQAFEELYFKWLQLSQSEELDPAEKDILVFYAYELILFLQDLQGE